MYKPCAWLEIVNAAQQQKTTIRIIRVDGIAAEPQPKEDQPKRFTISLTNQNLKLTAGVGLQALSYCYSSLTAAYLNCQYFRMENRKIRKTRHLSTGAVGRH
jgi:hypothetical protein